MGGLVSYWCGRGLHGSCSVRECECKTGVHPAFHQGSRPELELLPRDPVARAGALRDRAPRTGGR
jgi:hypothetical protein